MIKTHTTLPTLLLALIVGCATTPRGRAIQFGTVAKEVVDGGAALTKSYLDAKSSECEPAVASGLEALQSCLGPVASKPDEVDAIFEAVRAAQLGLYVALSDGSDPAAVKRSMADLQASIADVVAIIQRIRAEN